MISFPNAKINLGLNIIRKREDGFHDIETCFYPVGWQDVIEMVSSEKLSFEASGIPSGAPEDNLVLRAYNLITNDYPLKPLNIYLLKNIPVGAGLGGGSADAAFAIKLINSFFTLKLSEEQMEDYARQLGSDCAFFIRNKPVLAYGKGEQFAPTDLTLAGKYIVLVYPSLHISTKEAYAGVKPGTPEKELQHVLQSDFETWKKYLKNDFEESLFPKYPVLRDIKEKLYNLNALYACMSGSGSTVFGIFEKETDMKKSFPANYKIWQGKLS